MSLEQFKSALETECKIFNWTPSTEALYQIAVDIASSSALSLTSIKGVITSRVPKTIFKLHEGADCSDLKILLSLARKIAVR